MRNIGTFAAGLVFLATGVALTLEELDVWTLSIGDLRLIGPLVLILIGLVVMLGSIERRRHHN